MPPFSSGTQLWEPSDFLAEAVFILRQSLPTQTLVLDGPGLPHLACLGGSGCHAFEPTVPAAWNAIPSLLLLFSSRWLPVLLVPSTI